MRGRQIDPKARLSLSFLGSFEVTLDGHPVTTFESIKVRALLAYLAIEAGRSHARAFLAELLWPELPAATALTYLRHVLAKLKEAIPDRVPGREGTPPAGPPFLLVTRETVALNPVADYALDVADFTALLESCASHLHRHPETCASCARRRAAAVALYRGDFLDHFVLGDSAAFEEWAALKRERLRQQALDALARLARYSERRGGYQDGQRYAWRQVELDPWREEAYQQLMRTLWLSGQRSAALDQYARCRRILREELGVEPSAETTVLYERIRDTEAVPLSEVSPPHRPNNLPAQATPLIGREAELARLADLLEQPAYRLITLTGPGGIGKTRLALEAAELDYDFPDGVCFVALAPVTDPALVIPAIAHALGVQESSGQPLPERVKVHLRDRQLLLVLDNFEHIGAAASCVAALLGAAPGLAVLVTSRVVLRLYGEHEFPVPPLSVPNIEHVRSLPDLCRYEAVRLFAERAQAVQPDFALTGESAPAVAEICRRLDGLPLAIELAASRIRLLTPQTMLQRLSSPLALLTGGARDLPARQQTLRATIDWSYNLLPAGEQQLLARLAVFVGGWTLEAAEAICGGGNTLLCGTLDGFEALATKSLVRRLPAGTWGTADTPRFGMLETIREYALERLHASGEVAAFQQRHAEHYLACAETVAQVPAGDEQLGQQAALEVEQENLRAALAWLLEHQEIEAGLRLGVALRWLWLTRGSQREGRRWLDALLAASDQAPVADSLRADAQVVVGEIVWQLGDGPDAIGMLEAALGWEESLRLFREAGDRRGMARSLAWLGWHHHDRGDLAYGAQLMEEALALARELGDKDGIQTGLWRGGVIAYRAGDLDRARRLLEEQLMLAQAWGRIDYIAGALLQLAVTERYAGNLEQAEQRFEQRRRLSDWPGLTSPFGIAIERRYVGDLAFDQGEIERATRLYAESLAGFGALGHQWDCAAGIEALAAVADARGSAARAVRLWSAATAIRERISAPLPPVDRPRRDATLARLHPALGATLYAAASAEGEAMTLEQAVAYALDETTAE